MNDFFNGKFGLILAPNEQADFVEQCNQNGIEVSLLVVYSFLLDSMLARPRNVYARFDTNINSIVPAKFKVDGKAFSFRRWRKQKEFFERINITTEDSTVKVNFGNKAAGVAKCRPCDEFDLGLGAAIAMCRTIGAEKFNKALEIAKES